MSNQMSDVAFPRQGGAVAEVVRRAAFSALSTYNTAIGNVTDKAPVALTKAANDPWVIPASLYASDAATGRAFFPYKQRLRKELVFVITDADNDGIIARVWDWFLQIESDTAAFLVPSPVCDLAIQAGARAHGTITQGFYADTIAISNVSRHALEVPESFARGADDIARLSIPNVGASILEIQGTRSGGANSPAGFQFYAGDR